MNAIGIDVSNGKSMVSVLRPLGITVAQGYRVLGRRGHHASDATLRHAG